MRSPQEYDNVSRAHGRYDLVNIDSNSTKGEEIPVDLSQVSSAVEAYIHSPLSTPSVIIAHEIQPH